MERAETDTLHEYDCPRCGAATRHEFYGPCARCGDELRSTMRNDPREAREVEYEPKMNVVPNQVATKE